MQPHSRWHLRVLSVAALLLGSWTGLGVAEAQVPNGITQQGRVLDSEGSPVTSEVAMTFTIYDDPVAAEEGNVLWAEVLNIQLDDGYFSARIGEDGDNAFPADLWDGSVRYLGIQIGTDDELAPRARLASVPYAFVAGDVIGDIHPLSVTVNGKEVINANGDWVGNAVDRPFSSLLTMVTGAEVSTGAASAAAVATCPAGSFVTGGGCVGNAANTYDDDGDTNTAPALKSSYPSVVGGAAAPNQWNCRCYSGTEACLTTAYAMCVKN
jgi:hypothetical protein